MQVFIDIIVFIAHIYYLYIYKMISRTGFHMSYYIFYIIFLTFLLLCQFYHRYKQEYLYNLIEMIVYMFFIKFDFYIDLVLNFDNRYADPMIYKYLTFISYTILLFYIFYNLYLYVYNFMQQKKYTKQLEIDLKNNQVHLLRHDVSEVLHQINNDIKIENYQKAQDSIQSFLQKQYQTYSVITSIPSLNELFQLEFMKYKQDNIALSYFIDVIDPNHWNEKDNILIYDLLEKLIIKDNHVRLTLQQKPYGIICQIISQHPVKKQCMKKHRKQFQHQQLDNGDHSYTLLMPFSSSTQLFSQ